jgi:hypothetical protein
MTQQTGQPQPFSKEAAKKKTYSLVELVRAPTTMVDRGPEETIFSFPTLALLELLMALGVIAALLAMSLFVNAPLEEIANPNQTTDPAKAPWYFMGLQEMLEHGHPTLMAVALPTLMVLFVIAIPYLDNSRRGAGVWFTSERGKRICLHTTLYTLLVMPAYILLDTRFPLRELLRGQLPDFLLQLVFPAVILGVIVLLPIIVLRRQGPSRREVIMSLFTILIVSAFIFTMTGFWFRGPGFELYWPWDMPGDYSPLDNL